jgi:hypothetical protein
MMMTPSVTLTASMLSTLHTGERFWFWFCPAIPTDAPRLVVSTLALDPSMGSMLAAVTSLDVPLGARMFQGLASVTPQGIRFGAPGLSMDALISLGEWAEYNYFASPELALLKGAQFLDISPTGSVRSIHDADVWGMLPDVPLPGSPAAAAALIESLQDGQDAWFWVTDDGRSGAPAIVVSPRQSDASAHKLLSQRNRLKGEGSQSTGVLRSLGDRVVVTTAAALDSTETILMTLLGANPGVFGRLSGARLLRVIDGQVSVSRTLTSTAAQPRPSHLRLERYADDENRQSLS